MIRARGSLKGNITARGSLKGAVNIGIERIYPEVKNLDITPTAETQIFQDDKLNYGIVKVFGDANLQASNIKQGVSIFGVDGELEELTTETKEGINNQEEIITNQETTLEEINQVIQDKILVKEKYKPRYVYQPIAFRNYTGTELDHEVSMLDITSFTRTDNMFFYCKNLLKLDLNHWNTSNVTNMSSMFYECNSLSELKLSNWNTSNVTNMGSTFRGCNSLSELDLSNWNTSNVTKMDNMFSYLYNLTSLDLSHFDTSNVTDMGFMFYETKNLTYLDIRNFTFDKVTSKNVMFGNVPSNCLIIVKGETEKQWVLNVRGTLTNVKTVAELEG